MLAARHPGGKPSGTQQDMAVADGMWECKTADDD